MPLPPRKKVQRLTERSLRNFQIAPTDSTSFASSTMEDTARVCNPADNFSENTSQFPAKRRIMFLGGDRAAKPGSWRHLKYATLQLHSVDLQTSEDDDEVDSRDACPVPNPIHRFKEAPISAKSPASIAVPGKSLTIQTVNDGFDSKPRLTLSAFRRPEETIRLTHADPNRLLADEYDLQAPNCGVLGHGAFSTVRLAVRRSDGIKVAVKSIAKHEALRSRRLRLGGRSYLEEWEILRRFQDHPHVITLLDVLESDEEIQLVTEFCQGGELFDAIQKKRNRTCNRRRGQYTEVQAANITSQILKALVDLHGQNIVHRDVKPENILLANDDESALHVKLCDFGVARPLCTDSSQDLDGIGSGSDGESSPLTPGRSRSFSTIGSDYYAAPEIVFGGSYTAAVDIFSLGVSLYILLCGFPPVFSGEDGDDIVFPFAYWSDISEDAKDLLRKMLDHDPCERIDAKESLKHPWIRRNVSRSELPTRLNNSRRGSASNKATISNIVDLELVSNQLLRSLESIQSENSTPMATPSKKSGSAKRYICNVGDNDGGSNIAAPSPFKRARFERRMSSAFLALADLYRGVGTTPSGLMAAATAVESPPCTPRLEDPLPDELALGQHERSMKFAALSF